MNSYKAIIKSQKARLRILELLNFIPDKLMLKLQYRIKTGRKLNIQDPKRYTEKIQWYKLNYRDPLMTQCADKYSVREYVKSKNLNYILNDLYGVYENFNEIDFESFPNEFIIKTTHGSNTNIICHDQKELNLEEVEKKITSWMKQKYTSVGREWSYYNIKPRIIVEKLLQRDKNNDLPDYKFFCFNGEVYCLYTMIDYVDNHANGKLGFYNSSFEKLPYRRLDFGEITEDLDKPKNFEKMVEIAEVLSKGFPHVRVDLYNIDGKIVFGELTFYNASGYTVFEPDNFDFLLGEKFSLPLKSIK